MNLLLSAKFNGVRFLLCIAIVLVSLAASLKAQVSFHMPFADTVSIDFEELIRAKNINFRVLNSSTGEPVMLAHVLNLKRRVGVVSDMLGGFSIPVAFGDSLLITAIGYENRSVLCFGQFSADSLANFIALTPKTYKIEEVKVARFTTYERFIKSVVNLKLPKTEQELLTERISRYMKTIERRTGIANLPNATSGLAFGEDWFVKQKKKVDVAQKKERNRDLIYDKFSPGIVEMISGFKGDSLLKFIAYLDFKDDFLLRVTEYEIRIAIKNKLKTFTYKNEASLPADSVSSAINPSFSE